MFVTNKTCSIELQLGVLLISTGSTSQPNFTEMQSSWNSQLRAIRTYVDALGPSIQGGPEMAGSISNFVSNILLMQIFTLFYLYCQLKIMYR
jgi:hypothetical protein